VRALMLSNCTRAKLPRKLRSSIHALTLIVFRFISVTSEEVQGTKVSCQQIIEGPWNCSEASGSSCSVNTVQKALYFIQTKSGFNITAIVADGGQKAHEIPLNPGDVKCSVIYHVPDVGDCDFIFSAPQDCSLDNVELCSTSELLEENCGTNLLHSHATQPYHLTWLSAAGGSILSLILVLS